MLLCPPVLPNVRLARLFTSLSIVQLPCSFRFFSVLANLTEQDQHDLSLRIVSQMAPPAQLFKLPLELIHDVCDLLDSADLCSFRATSCLLEQQSRYAFNRRYFASKWIVYSKHGLKRLSKIVRSKRLLEGLPVMDITLFQPNLSGVVGADLKVRERREISESAFVHYTLPNIRTEILSNAPTKQTNAARNTHDERPRSRATNRESFLLGQRHFCDYEACDILKRIFKHLKSANVSISIGFRTSLGRRDRRVYFGSNKMSRIAHSPSSVYEPIWRIEKPRIEVYEMMESSLRAAATSRVRITGLEMRESRFGEGIHPATLATLLHSIKPEEHTPFETITNMSLHIHVLSYNSSVDDLDVSYPADLIKFLSAPKDLQHLKLVFGSETSSRVGSNPMRRGSVSKDVGSPTYRFIPNAFLAAFYVPGLRSFWLDSADVGECELAGFLQRHTYLQQVTLVNILLVTGTFSKIFSTISALPALTSAKIDAALPRHRQILL